MNIRKYLNLILFVTTSCSLAACQKTSPISQWTPEEKLTQFSKQAHHWGQKGQNTPNNGWSEYGSIKLFMGGLEYIHIYQKKGELFFQVITEHTELIKLSGLSIPGAGIFYKPNHIGSCRPDAFEQVGILVELALNYLANAYPSGPGNPLPENIKTATGPATEIRFMQAVAQLNAPWSADFEVQKSSSGNHKIKVIINGKPMYIYWQSEEVTFLDNNASINNWLPCWSGTQSRAPSGESSFVTDIKNTEAISTFGEIRE